MKFFPSLLMALAPIIFVIFSEAKVPVQASITKKRCAAQRKEFQVITKKLERLKKLQKENESLFYKYKSDFKAKLKISSNLEVIQIRSKTLNLRKKSLKEKLHRKSCKGPIS